MTSRSPHWADQIAQRVIAERGDKDEYTLAAGITPSGVVHIGNFREVITVDLVARALRDLGKKVRFIFSWDNFDTLRKVPLDIPNRDSVEQDLKRPIARIPDPYGEAADYASRHIQRFEAELKPMGIEVEFQYQHDLYGSGLYSEGIRQALEGKAAIIESLNEHRTSPLAADWLPTSIYCSQCDRDLMSKEEYPGGWSYIYQCASCGHNETIDIRTSKNLKLGWRVDWPMRWHHYGVDFEPGGKDHSSDGGSKDTAVKILKSVWGDAPPVYLQYDFVKIKGGPGKISSSRGGATSLSDVLKYYSPEMIRFIFARQKPNSDFAIAFDEDVIRLYDEFDRAEAAAMTRPENPNRKWEMNRRVIELSQVAAGQLHQTFRPPFRELCNRLQICDGDIDRTWERYYQKSSGEREQSDFDERAARAWNWLEDAAPAEFRYRINQACPEQELAEDQQLAIGALRELIAKTDLDQIPTKEFNQAIYDEVVHKVGIEAKPFFSTVYQRLISRDQGPRLPGFLKEIGKERLLHLLR